MRKKFFAIYALAGALVASPIFTSCVDNEESASVTAIRNEKVNQLKSLAALNNAMAQAETIKANAEATLKAAQAAQEQALADKYAAEAQIAELEAQLKADKYDAELAAALAQAESNKLYAEQSIANTQAQMQKNAIDLKAQLLRLEKDLIDAQEDLDDKIDQLAKEDLAAFEVKYQELKNLANKYSELLSNHNYYTAFVATQENNLAAIKADTVTWKETLAEGIAEREDAIALAEMQIEALKKYTNYTEDIEALKVELATAKAALDLADDKSYAAAGIVRDLKAAVNNNETLAELKEAYLEAVKAVEVKNRFTIEDENGNQIAWDYFNFNEYTPYKYSFEDGKISEESEYEYGQYLNLEVTYTADLAALKHKLDLKLLDLDIAGKKAAIETTETGYQALYDAAKKTADAKKAAYEAAAAADKATAKNEWDLAVTALENAQSNLEWAKQELAIAEEMAAQMNAVYTIVSDAKSCDALVAAAKAYNDEWTKVYTEIAKAEDAAAVAAEAAAEALIAYNTLDELLEGDSYTTNQWVADQSIWDFFNSQSSRWSNGGYSYQLYFEYVYDSNGNPVYDPNTGEHIYVEKYVNAWDYWWSGQTWLSNLIFAKYEEVTVYGENGALKVTEMVEALEAAIETAKKEIEELKNNTEKNRETEIARLESELEAKKNILEAMKLELDATKAKMDALKAELTAAE